MAISIDHELRCWDRDIYSVTFFNREIDTLVTHTAEMAEAWIDNVEFIYRRRIHRLVVGLDVEWLPNFNCKIHHPSATLQLCVGLDCLIFQLLYAEEMPKSLFDFLVDENYTFVGVGIDRDVEKLYDEYDLEVENIVDLRRLASKRMRRRELRNAGLAYLAKEVLGMEYEKPKKITLSKWDRPWLSHKQVQYACIDASLSYKIGRSIL